MTDSDPIDQASRLSDEWHQYAVANRVRYQGESATHCEECGAEIPQGRREAVPGTTTCVGCAE
ncbi:MAG TPA: TraR/DksA C4-type zinc finger protein [Gammaproteobacteria bacterium]|nr:TraR/DksA C4-type zinc finger protein [Gammaproteobacteria bacterium]